ncbi:hypothetical protein [Rummeliibacillus stabekisii]|uniref:hypothetical protein n=1 Tax=Rummeliibacillus stabekisii TaxID=241244 RepID=UPI0011665F79|nr:hypothetical protein [Rummeliibacillus stabekisii]MBB5168983.1 hypothetical protein [Rummeliibacillus stabekisii]GEL05623.1 hypothetical protein RST01_22500 [Rummeliibacillus stabekisii]
MDLNHLAGKKTLAWYIGEESKKDEPKNNNPENIKEGELTITYYEELKKENRRTRKGVGKKIDK